MNVTTQTRKKNRKRVVMKPLAVMAAQTANVFIVRGAEAVPSLKCAITLVQQNPNWN